MRMMRWRGAYFFWLLGLCGTLQADIRVLFAFDEAGLRVQRVLDVPLTSDFNSQLPGATLLVRPLEQVRIRWLNQLGQPLATTLEADPRMLQAPSHTDAWQISRLGARRGGWVSTGPDEATMVEVHLPEKPELALAAESWTLLLERDN